MRRSTALVTGWGVCATLLAAAAQQQPTFRGGVEIFHLDVSVLDRNRHPVRGLTAADFTVLEDGKAAKIVAVTDVELPAALPRSAAWTHEITPDVTSNQIDERRLFVMVLDDASMPADIRQDILAAERSVKRIANDIVDRLGPQDLMAIVFTADNRRPQDFTNDRPKLKAAIDRFTRVGGLSVQTAMQMSIEVLMRAAEFLIDIPERRKALLYLGVGVSVDVAMAAGPARIGSPNEFIEMRNRELHIRAVQRMTDMLAAAERANVNVYSFDARGLRTSARSLEVEFMQTISNHTGGRAFINTNDLGPGVEQLFRENASYYIVGYESVAEKGPGHWRRLDVRVNRTDVEVRARTRHYTDSPPPPRRNTAPPPETTRALAGLLPRREIPLTVTLAPFAIPERTDLVSVAAVIGIGRPADSAIAGGGSLRDLELQVSAFDPEGRPRGSQTYRVRAPLEGTSAGGAVAELVARTDLRPGAYQLRLALHDVQSKISGSIYADVEVPDFAKAPLSLSGVLFSSSVAPRSAPRDALAPLVPIQPTSAREFRQPDRATAFARIYQGSGTRPLVPVTLTTRIVDARSQVVFSNVETFGPDRFTTARAADVRLDLPLARLQPGPHLLTIEARASERTGATRQIPFEVH